jgi:hypothetical protein
VAKVTVLLEFLKNRPIYSYTSIKPKLINAKWFQIFFVCVDLFTKRARWEKHRQAPALSQVPWIFLSEHLFETPRVYILFSRGRKSAKKRRLTYGSYCIAPIRFILLKETVHRIRFALKSYAWIGLGTAVFPTEPRFFENSAKKRWKNFVISGNKHSSKSSVNVLYDTLSIRCGDGHN